MRGGCSAQPAWRPVWGALPISHAFEDFFNVECADSEASLLAGGGSHHIAHALPGACPAAGPREILRGDLPAQQKPAAGKCWQHRDPQPVTVLGQLQVPKAAQGAASLILRGALLEAGGHDPDLSRMEIHVGHWGLWWTPNLPCCFN